MIAVYLLRRPIARALTLAVGVLLPVAVAASRLELGVHWPTDVVAGLALGALVALVTTCGGDLGRGPARRSQAPRPHAHASVASSAPGDTSAVSAGSS